MNPVKALQVLVDTTEKLYTMPHDEIMKNGQLVDEMRQAVSAHNIDGILNAVKESIANFADHKTAQAVNTDALLRAYAKREHSRVKDADSRQYVTEIINAGDMRENFTPAKAKRKDEKQFAEVFNSVYSDGALKINTPSDPSTLMSYIDYSPYRVNYTEYLSVPTLSEMVDRPIQMALKKFPKVKSKSKELQDALDVAFRKAQVHSVVKEAVFNSILSPRGSLVVPIKRSDRVTFNVFNDTQFSYGMGSSYSGVDQPYDPIGVGPLYCMGAKLKNGVSAHFTCPGYEPLFGVGLNRVPQLRATAEAWNLYVHVLKILLVRAQVIIERMDGDIQTDTMLSQMRSQLQRFSQTMGVSTPIAQARGATLDILNNNISEGTSSIAGVFRDFVASVTGLAPEYFFGGGNANYSQAAFQIASTNENIRARYQVGMIEPIMRFIVNTLIRNDESVRACGVEPDDFEIEFESIYEQTEQECAELVAKKTETLIRQAEYPELSDAFKRLELLDDAVTLPAVEPHEGEEPGGEKTDSVLRNPLG